MRYRHIIFLGNSYTRGYRVALHSAIGASEVPPDRRAILDSLGSLRISYHTVVTDSPSWESVPEVDPYFEGVRLVSGIDEFIEAVKEDGVLSKADVETYIKSYGNVSDKDMDAILRRCNQRCLDELGYPLYDPAKRDCQTAHVLDESISSNRILASADGRTKLRIIDSVLASA